MGTQLTGVCVSVCVATQSDMDIATLHFSLALSEDNVFLEGRILNAKITLLIVKQANGL